MLRFIFHVPVSSVTKEGTHIKETFIISNDLVMTTSFWNFG